MTRVTNRSGKVCVAVFVLLVALFAGAGQAFAAPGDPDQSFGQDGLVAPAFCGESTPRPNSGPPLPTDTIVSPDGDIYVAGQCDDAIFVSRFLPDGAVDTTYGTNGEWIGNFGGGQSPQTGDLVIGDGPPVRLALTPSGGLIVATYAEDANDNPEVAVAELTSSGALDSGFASGGVLVQQLSQQPVPDSDVSSDFYGSRPFAVAVQPDGRILIAGFADSSDSVPEVLVERLSANGQPDLSFGSDGAYKHQYGPNPDGTDAEFSVAEGMLLEPNGDIVLAIAADVDTISIPEFVIDRLGPNGTPDPTFTPTYAQLGVGAADPYPPGSMPTAIAQASNGDYLLAGGANESNEDSSRPNNLMAVAEFTTSGPLDLSFGTGGVWESGDAPAEAGAVAVAANGDIVLTSNTDEDPPGSGSTDESFQYVVRLLPSGIEDSSFGSDGNRSYDLSTDPDASDVSETYSTDSAMTSDGDLVTVGAATAPNADIYDYVQELDLDAGPAASTPTPPVTPTQADISPVVSSTQSPATGEQVTTPTSSTSLPGAAADCVTSKAGSTACNSTAQGKAPTLVSVSSGGAVVRVKVRCALTACRLTAELTTIQQLKAKRRMSRHETRSRRDTVSLARQKTVRIGSAQITFRPGTTRIWTIKLNAVGSKLLHRQRRLTVRLVLKTKDARATTFATKRLTLHDR